MWWCMANNWQRFAMCVVIFIATQDVLALTLANHDKYKVSDADMWHSITAESSEISFLFLQQALNESPGPVPTVLGLQGGYGAKLRIENSFQDQKLWYVLVNANFIDTGLAYWVPDTEPPLKLANFSQLSDSQSPHILHYQAVSLPIAAGETGELYIYVSAKHFAYPLSLQVLSESEFYRKQLLMNSVTVGSIAIMLVLALISCILFIRTHYILTLACAGYVGLHGLGWATASGLMDDLFDITWANTTYGGMYLFPFAIACAAYFTRVLFNCDVRAIKTARVLSAFTIASFFLGVIGLFLELYQVFIIAHILALIWLPITLLVGVSMLGEGDFRARYYLMGNSLYAASLAYYMFTHISDTPTQLYPELIVVGALSLDCVCILLSLSEWLKNQQTEYSRSYNQARFDPLTKVGNRFAFNEEIKALNKDVIIAFIDLDGMKSVNDRLGHEQGDRFLQDAAMFMDDCLKGKGKVFRAGGDEFIWLIDQVQFTSYEECVRTLGGVVDKIENKLERGGWNNVGISIGMASTAETPSISACLALADERMYQNKRQKITEKFL